MHPITLAASKQLLPVYDKQMIYYPLSTLIPASIRDIMIISTPADLPQFERLLSDGSRFGVRFKYRVQPSPDDIVQAFPIGDDWLCRSPCALALGDNLIFADRLGTLLRAASARPEGAAVSAYQVHDPQRCGIVTFDESGRAPEVVEKPPNPRMNRGCNRAVFLRQPPAQVGPPDQAERARRARDHQPEPVLPNVIKSANSLPYRNVCLA